MPGDCISWEGDDASEYPEGYEMGYIPQAWPVQYQPQSNVIIEENELFLLGLLLSFNQLYKRDNPGLLREHLPTLKERVQRVYQCAREVERQIEGQTRPPLWAKLIREIVSTYPGILAELKAIEPDLKANRFIRMKPVLVGIFNKCAAIHVRLLKIPGGKTRYVLQLENFNLFTQVIK